jgi:glycosyltransferase involved in cell wall biosynthesis
MKILHVNYSDIVGGAAIAVNNLHNYLIKNKVDSKILVVDKNTNDKNILGPRNKLEKYFFDFRSKLAKYFIRKIHYSPIKNSYSLNYYNTNILKKINNLNVDLVHLHWIGNEMISVSQIKKIKKPIIWTFWDMWPLSGAEHYSYDNRYSEGYNKNNRPHEERKLDLNKIIWNYKLKNFDIKFNIICPSTWLYDCAKKSVLFHKSKIKHIPISIDTDYWVNQGSIKSRKKLNISLDKKILLFSSTSGTNDRKGFNFLVDAINNFKNKNLFLVVVGEKPKRLKELKIEYKYFGKIEDIANQRLIYSSVDLILMPSIREVFGLVALEGASCSVPSVIFNDNGCSDLIEHKFNGYIAEKKNSLDFQRGIDWCISDEKRMYELKFNAREKAKNFDNKINYKKFLSYYKSIIDNEY